LTKAKFFTHESDFTARSVLAVGAWGDVMAWGYGGDGVAVVVNGDTNSAILLIA
jgi:hypothetical protein